MKSINVVRYKRKPEIVSVSIFPVIVLGVCYSASEAVNAGMAI